MATATVENTNDAGPIFLRIKHSSPQPKSHREGLLSQDAPGQDICRN